MRTLINYLGVLSAFLVLGAGMAFAEWVSQFEVIGWVIFGGITALSIWGTIAIWKASR